MDIEEAFLAVGGCGRFQFLVTGTNFMTNKFPEVCLTNVQFRLLHMTPMLFGAQMLLMVIVGATPDLSVPVEANFTTIVTEWRLYDKTWVVDLMTSLYMAGYITGTLLFGQLPDLFGRKKMLLIHYALSTICGLCSAFCHTWQTFAVTRFVSGVFVGGAAPPAFVLLCELIGKDKWASMGMIYQMFFSLGVMQLSVLGLVLQDWRKVIYVSTAIAALLWPFLYFFVPESPRWLYSVGRIEEAEKIMKLIAKKNKKDENSINLIASDNVKAETLRKYNFLDMIHIKSLTIRFFICCYLWFACSISYYGLTLNASDLASNLFMAVILSAAVEIPSYIVTIILMEQKWAGRKGTTMFLLFASSISSIGVIFIADGKSAAKLVLGLISKLTIAGGFCILYVYVSELFPTQLRTLALGSANIFARVGAIVAPFVPLLESTACFLPYAVFGSISLTAGTLNIFLPETLGQNVPSMNDYLGDNHPNLGAICDENIKVNQDKKRSCC